MRFGSSTVKIATPPIGLPSFFNFEIKRDCGHSARARKMTMLRLRTDAALFLTGLRVWHFRLYRMFEDHESLQLQPYAAFGMSFKFWGKEPKNHLFRKCCKKQSNK